MVDLTRAIHETVSKLCSDNPIIPVVVIDDPANALEAGQALLAGGITCAELTFRTERAADVVVELAKVPGLDVGAGTILNVRQATRAVAAGASFLVSPGFSPEVAQYAIAQNVAYMPGVSTATEIMTAHNMGFEILKFFPAVASGGLPMVSSLAGPFPQISFVTTGGIGPQNLKEWISHPAVASVGGSWMITRDDVAARCFDRITELSREAMATAEEARK